MSEESIKVKLTDMNSEILKDAQSVILDSIKKNSNERDIAYQIKREMDKRYLPSWHCIVGRNFGQYITHEEGYYIQALKGQLTIVLWK